MLSSGDGLTVRPVTPVEAAVPVTAIGDTRGDLYQRALQRILGQQLLGEVMSRFNDGSFMLKLGDTSARLMLPDGSKVGDKIPLTLISLEPKPTFQIGTQAQASQAAVVALSQPAQEERPLPSTARAESEPEAAQTAARQGPPPDAMPMAGANSRILRQFAQIGAMYRPEYDMSAKNLDEGSPVLTPDGALIAHLETPLPNKNPAHGHASFSNAGKLINQLLLATKRDGMPAAVQGKEAVVNGPEQPPQQVAAALQQTINNSGLFYESHLAQWADGKRSMQDLLHEPQMQGMDQIKDVKPEANRIEFAHLVNLQLNTLEQQRAHWHGEIWPGQEMDWEVSKDEQQAGSGAESGGAWQSVVKFHLPELGEVQAHIHLLGSRLHIQIQTENEGSASMLRAHADSLSEALLAAGSPLDSLTVGSHE